jgi:hypothetical protein
MRNEYLVTHAGELGGLLQKFKLTTGAYARMGRKFLWKYDKELDLSLQRLLATAMQECESRDWRDFDFIRRRVVALFGFGADIQDTIVQDKCVRHPENLVLCSANGEDRFYVRWLAHSNAFVVQYHGLLAPPSLDVKAPEDL